MPDFCGFIRSMCSEPMLLFVAVSAALMCLVNGWTDAPVTVAGAVSSGALKIYPAVALSAVCNFAGAVFMMLAGNKIAGAVYNISGVGSADPQVAVKALLAAMITVTIWSLVALCAGIPTSESHALLSAFAGSALSASGFSAVSGREWIFVLLGLVLSSFPAVYLTYFGVRLLRKTWHGSVSDKVSKKLQICGAAVSSFAHGAQDGGKFAGVFTAAAVICLGGNERYVCAPVWAISVSALLISSGMLLGGRKIIKTVGKLAPTEAFPGFLADLVSGVLLTAMSLFGIPASTTHAKTCAIIGAGMTRKKGKLEALIVLKMTAAWVLTFPACAALGFLLTRIFVFIF